MVTDASGNGFYWGNRLEMNLWSKRIIIYIYKLNCIYNRENHPIFCGSCFFPTRTWCVLICLKWQNHWPSQGATWLSVVDPNGTGHEICYKARKGLPSRNRRRMGNPLEMEFGEIMGKSSIKRGIVHWFHYRPVVFGAELSMSIP